MATEERNLDIFLQLLRMSEELKELLLGGEGAKHAAVARSVPLADEVQLIVSKIQAGAEAACNEDKNNLVSDVLKWANPSGIKSVPWKDVKILRGFRHDFTGALLCPFELDWSDPVVQTLLRYDHLCYATGKYLPAFLFESVNREPGNVWNGFLRNAILVTAYRHIFATDRETLRARAPTLAQRVGQGPQVTLPSIVYVATQVRHALSCSVVFDEVDQRSGSDYSQENMAPGGSDSEHSVPDTQLGPRMLVSPIHSLEGPERAPSDDTGIHHDVSASESEHGRQEALHHQDPVAAPSNQVYETMDAASIHRELWNHAPEVPETATAASWSTSLRRDSEESRSSPTGQAVRHAFADLIDGVLVDEPNANFYLPKDVGAFSSMLMDNIKEDPGLDSRGGGSHRPQIVEFTGPSQCLDPAQASNTGAVGTHKLPQEEQLPTSIQTFSNATELDLSVDGKGPSGGPPGQSRWADSPFVILGRRAFGKGGIGKKTQAA
ncbi:hypothetical protein DXG01_014359 [Tephrocybe rancida]|nr:hypothetical protein DXG01_014359 [Tephrocybe rancida]